MIQKVGISDGFICWAEGDSNSSTYRIMARDLNTNTEFVVEPLINGHLVWSVGKGYIVWMSNPERFSDYYEDIGVYNLRNRNKSQIHVTPGYRNNVRMSDTKVIWYESKNLRGLDILTNESFTYPLLGYSSDLDTLFEFTNDYIAYYDRGKIIVYNLTNGTQTNIPTSDKYTDIKISGDILVWLDYSGGRAGDLVAYDLLAEKETRLPETWSHSWNESVSGDVIIWVDDRNDRYDDIYGYDLQTGTEFPICTAPGYQQRPVIENNTVVWIDRRNGWNAECSIYGAQISRNTSNNK
jgi:beta propeller repeat protein